MRANDVKFKAKFFCKDTCELQVLSQECVEMYQNVLGVAIALHQHCSGVVSKISNFQGFAGKSESLKNIQFLSLSGVFLSYVLSFYRFFVVVLHTLYF